MKVSLIKYHLSGILNGMKTNEMMSFVDWDAACEWAAKVTMSEDTNYVVLEMKNLENGVVEFF